MKAKYIARLEQVVRVLEELHKEKRFNLLGWMECGTVGCAIGWAASDPWFRRRGLKLMKSSLKSKFYYPKFNEHVGMYAVKAFFGLALSEASHLFMRDQYDRDGSKRAVIRRLKGFVKQQREAA